MTKDEREFYEKYKNQIQSNNENYAILNKEKEISIFNIKENREIYNERIKETQDKFVVDFFLEEKYDFLFLMIIDNNYKLFNAKTKQITNIKEFSEQEYGGYREEKDSIVFMTMDDNEYKYFIK